MEEDKTEDRTESRDGSGNRRSFITRTVLGGAALAAGGAVVGAGAAAAASGEQRESLVLECAVLGPTIRDLPLFLLMPERGLEEGDVLGSPFFAEGYLYPEGTISGDGFVPTDEGTIGTFLCRGHFLLGPARPEPHLATHQEYYLGDLTSFPLVSDMLASEGIEGSNTAPWEAMRIVTGGTGQYRGARGQVLQRQIGVNSTVDQFGNPAPVHRFEFDIDLP